MKYISRTRAGHIGVYTPTEFMPLLVARFHRGFAPVRSRGGPPGLSGIIGLLRLLPGTRSLLDDPSSQRALRRAYGDVRDGRLVRWMTSFFLDLGVPAEAMQKFALPPLPDGPIPLAEGQQLVLQSMLDGYLHAGGRSDDAFAGLVRFAIDRLRKVEADDRWLFGTPPGALDRAVADLIFVLWVSQRLQRSVAGAESEENVGDALPWKPGPVDDGSALRPSRHVYLSALIERRTAALDPVNPEQRRVQAAGIAQARQRDGIESDDEAVAKTIQRLLGPASLDCSDVTPLRSGPADRIGRGASFVPAQHAVTADALGLCLGIPAETPALHVLVRELDLIDAVQRFLLTIVDEPAAVVDAFECATDVSRSLDAQLARFAGD